MSTWIENAENQRLLDQLCVNRTPITIVDRDDPNYKIDVIPVAFQAECLQSIVDEDDNAYGLKRGELIMDDPADIGDVIIREKQPEVQSA